ncbi:toprim domain-containing protein [Leptospirillum ferriphilum]|uniref:toprim domain-containing protein n=1 Tax=Leptospirillum ferriphilum TaxID=178606 RepID=UPI0006B1A25A|nr:toprim domain-containing protein [Leptospirillum ferriphilum]
MVDNLWIIEADGKVRKFREILKKAGLTGPVFATGGHLFSAPKSLHPLLIDRDYRDFRIPVRPERVEELRQAVKATHHLFVATDPDDEGDVIAADVGMIAKSINPGLVVTRIRLSVLHDKVLAKAVQEGAFLRPEDSVPGTVRRVLDRWIGGTFSKGLPVGRVFSAYLAFSATRVPVIGKVVVRYPAIEGAAYSATIPLTPDNRKEWSLRLKELSHCPKAVPGTTKEISRNPPFSFGDALLALRRDAGLSISEGARKIQHLYENGILSYPRTDSRGLTPETAESLLPLARKMGFSDYDPVRVPEKPDTSPHEALHPMTGDLGRIRDPVDRRIVEMITKSALGSGLPPVLAEEPGPTNLPEWARELNLWRPMNRFGPDRVVSLPAGIYPDPPDAAVLSGLMEAGLGRPSTLPSHVMKILAQNVLGKDFRPNGKGRAAMDKAPEAIRSEEFTRRMETILRKMKEQGASVQSAMREILSTLPEPVREQMESALADELPADLSEENLPEIVSPREIALDWNMD